MSRKWIRHTDRFISLDDIRKLFWWDDISYGGKKFKNFSLVYVRGNSGEVYLGCNNVVHFKDKIYFLEADYKNGVIGDADIRRLNRRLSNNLERWLVDDVDLIYDVGEEFARCVSGENVLVQREED